MRFIKGVYATALFILTLGVFVAAPAFAQAARDGRVQVTVVDQSGGVVPGASVTLVGLETPTQAQAAPTATSGDNGIAILERVAPGRYSVRAEFPGFDLGLLRDIRVRAGDNRHVVVLPLAKLETSVTVGRNLQEVAADRRSSQFGNAVASATARRARRMILRNCSASSRNSPDPRRSSASTASKGSNCRRRRRSNRFTSSAISSQRNPPTRAARSSTSSRSRASVRSAAALNLNFFDDVLALEEPASSIEARRAVTAVRRQYRRRADRGPDQLLAEPQRAEPVHARPIVNVAGVDGTTARNAAAAGAARVHQRERPRRSRADEEPGVAACRTR